MNTLKTILCFNLSLNQFFLLFIFAPSISVFYSSCDDASLILQTSDLQIAKEQWQQTNIEDYQVEIERVCFCATPFRYIMTVEKGKVVQILDSETGESVEPNSGYSTIDELFTWLEQIAVQNPKKLDLEFHAELGYPTYIDYNQSDMIADEEMFMRLKDLQIE